MKKEEKIESIRKALEMGITQIRICPQAKSESLRKLLKDSSRVGDKKIDEMYQNAVDCMAGFQTTTISAKPQIAPKNNFSEIINEQNKKIKQLGDEIVQIKKILAKIQENNTRQSFSEKEKNSPEHILDFSIIKNTSINKKGNKKYKYDIFYAIRTIKGKQIKIYIGKNIENAEQKIKNYCKKHKISF